MKYFTLIVVLFIVTKSLGQTSDWIAPPTADNIKNPITSNTDVLKEAKKIYVQQCALCHGDKGKGDGFAGVALKPRPADLVSSKFLSQTDGAIFWKMTTGRAPMANYKDIIEDEVLWKIIHYLRTLQSEKS